MDDHINQNMEQQENTFKEAARTPMVTLLEELQRSTAQVGGSVDTNMSHEINKSSLH